MYIIVYIGGYDNWQVRRSSKPINLAPTQRARVRFLHRLPRGVSYVVDPRSSTSKVAMMTTKLVPYIGNIISAGDDIGEPCQVGIPRERKARRE